MFDGGKRIEYPRDIPLSNNLLLEKYVEKLFPREEEADKIKLEANSLLKAGCARDAVACYDRAIAVSPDSHTLHGNKAQALLQLQDWAGALAAADASAARVPRWPKAHFRRGAALEGLGAPRAAECAAAFALCLVLIELHREETRGFGATLADEAAARERLECTAAAALAAGAGEVEVVAEVRRGVAALGAGGGRGGAAGTGAAGAAWRLGTLAEDDADFECSLCCSLLFEPTTTACAPPPSSY